MLKRIVKLMCNPNQKTLCGKKECNICYVRSLQKYLDGNKINSNFIKCIDDIKLIPILLMIGSGKKCEFRCKNCSSNIISGVRNYIRHSKCCYCRVNRKSNTEEFIEKARSVHEDKYDYSKVKYIDSNTKVIIICPDGHEFEQTPQTHLSGRGCLSCSGRKKSNTEEFIEKARLVHGNKYNYDKVNYVNCKTKIIIICPLQHEFEQMPRCHLKGDGCPYCSNSRKLNIEEFIKNARLVHGNKYNYDKVNYINVRTNVIIICPEHEEFEQMPRTHLSGGGCKYCKNKTQSKLYTYIKSIYPDAISEYKLTNINNSLYDIYIPSLSLFIELDGPQHFVQVSNWNDPIYTQYKDIYKALMAKKNAISMIRIYQPDVANDKIDWKEQLKLYLVKSDKFTINYIASNPSIYDRHKLLLSHGNRMFRYINDNTSSLRNHINYFHINNDTYKFTLSDKFIFNINTICTNLNIKEEYIIDKLYKIYTEYLLTPIHVEEEDNNIIVTKHKKNDNYIGVYDLLLHS